VICKHRCQRDVISVMATSDDRLPNIDKLTDANWPVWKLQIQTYLEARELWKLCTGDETEPVAPADGDDDAMAAFAQQLSRYQVRIARVKSVLFQMISTGQLHVIAQQRLQTPKDMWKELVDTFERPSLSNKLQLQTRLLDLRMESGTCSTVDDYLKELQELTERLAALGAPVEADFQVALALRGLSPEYDALRVALVTKGTVTMSELREALRTEEHRLYSNSGQVGACGTSVLSVRSGVQQRTSGKGRVTGPPGSCYGCGKMGHFHRDCPVNPYMQLRKQKSSGMSVANKHNVKKAECCVNDSNFDDEVDNSEFTDGGDVMFTVLYGDQISSDPQDVWIIDSGATKHMSPCRSMFTDFVPFRVTESVSLGNGVDCEAVGIGRVSVNMLCEGTVKRYILSDVLFVPNLVNNFFSVTAATLKGHTVTFKGKQCFFHRDGKLIATGNRVNRLWYIDCAPEDVCANLKDIQDVSKLTLWHQRLGHVNEKRLKTAVKKQLIVGVDTVDFESPVTKLPFCEACVEGKQTRKPFHGTANVQTTETLQLIHSDVCGPMSVGSLGNSRYFVTFTDDYSRFCYVYFLKNKSQVFEKFKEFHAEVTNLTDKRIKTLRTDNGGEYTSIEFEQYLKNNGIRHEVSTPFTPEQNGVSERLNRTLQEMALSQIVHAGLSKHFWADSIAAACYIRNRLPVCPLNVSPYEKWYGKKPNVNHVRVFGCVAYALKPGVYRTKMDVKSEKMRFIGYSLNAKGYRLYDEKRNQVVVRRDVIFNEADFGAQRPAVDPVTVDSDTGVTPTVPAAASRRQSESSSPIVQQPVRQIVAQSPMQSVRRSQRQVKPPDRFGDWAEESEYDLESLDVAGHVPVCNSETRHCLYFSNINEPRTIDEALKTPEAVEWKQAADEEMQAHETMNTWKLVPLPQGRKPVDCKWIFKVKNKSDGTIERFKARLVAKGCSQQPGTDFTETFSPVVRLNNLRSLLAYAVQNNMLIHQMDIVTAFLHGHLQEEVYMKQPPGYVKEGQENLVCHLQRSLYGLKQSPRCWNDTFCDYLKELGFTPLKSDCCIFRKENPLVFVALYVDDLIPIAENMEVMHAVKVDIMKRFPAKDMGPLHYVLGITCIQDDHSNRIGLTQEVYIDKLINRFDLTDALPVCTPSDVNVTLMKDDGVSKPIDKSYYQSLVGCLLYVAVATRPDIQYAVSTVAKYNANPDQSHLTAAKRILRYLMNTKSLVLWYNQNDHKLIGYSDADYARDVDDRHSTSGYVFLFGSGAVSWYSGKQKGISTSTSQAEYVALSHAAKEAVFLRQLLTEFKDADCGPIPIQEDNQAALAIAKNPVFHSKTKHIDVSYHFTREAVTNGQIKLEYCHTKNMIADILTKPLAKIQFEHLRSMLGLM